MPINLTRHCPLIGSEAVELASSVTASGHSALFAAFGRSRKANIFVRLGLLELALRIRSCVSFAELSVCRNTQMLKSSRIASTVGSMMMTAARSYTLVNNVYLTRIRFQKPTASLVIQSSALHKIVCIVDMIAARQVQRIPRKVFLVAHYNKDARLSRTS